LTILYAVITYSVDSKCYYYTVGHKKSQLITPLYFYHVVCFFMVALCNRADHYILACDFYLLISSSFFFPRLISAVGDWTSTILPHMVWP